MRQHTGEHHHYHATTLCCFIGLKCDEKHSFSAGIFPGLCELELWATLQEIVVFDMGCLLCTVHVNIQQIPQCYRFELISSITRSTKSFVSNIAGEK